jgi:hypothetical protein
LVTALDSISGGTDIIVVVVVVVVVAAGSTLTKCATKDEHLKTR